MNFKVALTTLTFSLLLIGCQKTETPKDFKPIADIIKPTETKLSDRTPEWYKNQENIRDQVTDVCLNYFTDEADRIGGEYKEKIYNDIFSAFKDIPDCINAREGYILSLYEGKEPLTEFQLQSIENETKDPKNIAHVNQVAEELANKFKAIDDNEADNQLSSSAVVN